MTYPVDLSLLHNATHMPAVPVLARTMNRPDLQLHDFCIPVNPYFPTPSMMADLRRRLEAVLRYYPSDNWSLAEQLGEFTGIDPRYLVVANGSTELISWINERLITRDLVTDVPTFGRWTDNARELGRRVLPFHRRRDQAFMLDVDELVRFTRARGSRALAVCNPNNPTGSLLSRDDVLRLLDATRDLDVVVVDESFIDFADEDTIPTVAHDVADYDHAIVIKSLGKNLGLHGLRCGYAVAGDRLATGLRRMLPPWNVNSLAEEFIRLVATCPDEYESARQQVVRDSRQFAARLSCIEEITTYRTHANFVFCELADWIPGRELRDALLRDHGCFVRECGSKLGSSAQFLRIAMRPTSEQMLLVQAIGSVFAQLDRDAVPGETDEQVAAGSPD